jgi:hypothetical protein
LVREFLYRFLGKFNGLAALGSVAKVCLHFSDERRPLSSWFVLIPGFILTTLDDKASV